MSATYNWAYRPGVNNKYGLSIPDTADNIRPDGYCYVALFGNDITGNGSRLYPYKTLSNAYAAVGRVPFILSSGVYREPTPINITIVGDGDVVFDGTQIGELVLPYCSNIKFRNANNSFNTFKSSLIDCSFDNCFDCFQNSSSNPYNNWINTVFSNLRGSSAKLYLNYRAQVNTNKNLTFYNCSGIEFLGSDFIDNNNNYIMHSCDIWFHQASCLSYSLFYNCKFKFGGTEPSTPDDYISYDNIDDLKEAHLSSFPLLQSNFKGCIIADPLFNNPSIGDYTLQFNSPAKNLSYFGTYVGAKSIAQVIKVSSTESTGGFDFSSAVNLTIADDSITLSNPALDGRIDTRVIVNLLGRELASLPSYGFNADRNGQYIDSIADLATSTQAAGVALLVPVPYLVETGAITYNGAVYQAGERFTTVAGQTTFTTTASGVVREILEAPQRHTVLARFGAGGATVTAGNALVGGYWYFVQNGSVVYNGVTYTAAQVFKAIDTHAFSGSGSVIIAMSTEAYQHYELGSKPTSNNTGDQRTGAIIRGNGDPVYERGGLGVKEFPITAKFIQVSYIIKVNNLKP
ncbi:MAG: hypothetical protein JWR38_5235 [Mucilaginibacter sp.]|nr:hypothetical protein [Mucilaginibacter sp.]